ncbi:MAG: hypothetical protein L0Y72_05520 [Gemmataceae bacterium]|nr:hypothetical protein [Gemmataceae bacterium]MCI0738483.1 hypothetical protein [Gemmataceae bacterium]
MRMTSFGGIWRGVVGCLPLLFLAPLGCGGKSAPPTATVNGKVTYKKQLLKGGSMAFFLSSDHSKGATAGIKEDGTYTATGVPVGEVKVTVETTSLQPSPTPPPQLAKELPKDLPEGSPYGKPKQVQDPKNYVRIPDLYSIPDQTTLKYTIAEGTQTIDIELK